MWGWRKGETEKAANIALMMYLNRGMDALNAGKGTKYEIKAKPEPLKREVNVFAMWAIVCLISYITDYPS